MAKYAKKKQGIAGLIFIWVLVILLAIGTFGVINHYTLNNTDIIQNAELAEILSASLDKPIGKITQEDLATIEGIGFADYGTMGEIIVYLPGYNAAYEAYTAEGITDEEKEELVDPSDFMYYTYFSDADIYDDLKLFSGITSLTIINNTSNFSDIDVLSIAAENAPNLTSLGITSFAINDFSVISKLTKLESLSIYDSNLTDISAISSLENLKYLDISETELSDISALKSLDNEKIEMIYLAGNKITDWSPIDHIDADKVTKEEESEEETSDEAADETTEDDATASEGTDEETETAEN